MVKRFGLKRSLFICLFLLDFSQDNESMDEERLWRDLIMERVTKSADACLTALNIMTSPRMPKAVYIEDVIERVLQFTKFHLQNTLYPQYDPAYRLDRHGGQSQRMTAVLTVSTVLSCGCMNS